MIAAIEQLLRLLQFALKVAADVAVIVDLALEIKSKVAELLAQRPAQALPATV